MDRKRLVAGLDAQYERRGTLLGLPVVSTAGFQFRLDRPQVVLAHTADRHVLARTQDVSILEMSYSPFLKLDLTPLPWLRFLTGARGDVFRYEVHNDLRGVPDQPDGRATRAIASSKANLSLGPWYRTELFANFGTGFHSNDARAVIVDRTLPALAQATAYEFGVRTRALPRIEMSATYWVLTLASELVFNSPQVTRERSSAVLPRDSSSPMIWAGHDTAAAAGGVLGFVEKALQIKPDYAEAHTSVSSGTGNSNAANAIDTGADRVYSAPSTICQICQYETHGLPLRDSRRKEPSRITSCPRPATALRRRCRAADVEVHGSVPVSCATRITTRRLAPFRW
jgi:hypothetical protein